jgi:hypothetical protein
VYEDIRFYRRDDFPSTKDPHSKALEPDCLSPSASNYDTAAREREGVRAKNILGKV